MTGRIAPRDSVVSMAGYHSPQLDVDVRLNTNESPLGPPPEFSDAVADALRSVNWNRYPDRHANGLRGAIASHHGTATGQVFAANGSNEVLQTLLLTYGGAGRSAAMFEPTYALHSHLSRITGTGVIYGERRDDFSFDIDEAARVIAAGNPSIVFLCSPNNPTGMIDQRSDVEAVLEIAAGAGALLCVDEAYAQFAPWSATDLLGPDVPLVVTRTYSKTWAMAGARLGYLVGPEWVVDDLEKVVLPYHLDAATQIAGTLALRYIDAMNERVEKLITDRDKLAAAMARLPVHVWPSAANFILFRPEAMPGHDVWQALVDRSVLVRDCASWPRLTDCLRVTIGTTEEDKRFLDALTEVLQ